MGGDARQLKVCQVPLEPRAQVRLTEFTIPDRARRMEGSCPAPAGPSVPQTGSPSDLLPGLSAVFCLLNGFFWQISCLTEGFRQSM